MKYLIVFVFISQISFGQRVSIDKKIDMPDKIDETSGIVYLKKEKKIITFNDSGGKPELYVLNAKSGKLKRTVKVKNAHNHDWESITRDEKYIYVGDTGNNYGNRTNLVIYKIAIKDVLHKESVKADKIHYSYEDQVSFATANHQTNFDCESITTYHGELYIFTKNWKDYKTNVYTLPTTKGDYNAVKRYSLAIDCLLTSIAFNPKNNSFMGTAYDSEYKSYLIQVKENELKQNQFQKIDLLDVLGYANQTEAIAWKNKNQVYISREASNKTLKGKKYKRKQKLILLTLNK